MFTTNCYLFPPLQVDMLPVNDFSSPQPQGKSLSQSDGIVCHVSVSPELSP